MRSYDRTRPQLAISYARSGGGRDLTFEIELGGFPFNMRDRETGSLWKSEVWQR